MPCTDITESLILTLDRRECVQSFSLRKSNCDTSVGSADLLPYIRGARLERILSLGLSNWVPEIDDLGDQSQFLLHKQFYAIRSAAAVILGVTKGDQKAPFFLESYDYTKTTIDVRGLISIDLDTEGIKACNSCCSQKMKETAISFGLVKHP